MRRPPRPQDDDRDDIDKHCNDDNSNDNDYHCGAVEMNAGESDGADDIEGDNIEEADEIEDR